eukprot:356075-Chlamydomonas_euryale.AAC.3
MNGTRPAAPFTHHTLATPLTRAHSWTLEHPAALCIPQTSILGLCMLPTRHAVPVGGHCAVGRPTYLPPSCGLAAHCPPAFHPPTTYLPATYRLPVACSRFCSIPEETQAVARFLAKAEGVLAGLGVADIVFHTVDPSLQVRTYGRACGPGCGERGGPHHISFRPAGVDMRRFGPYVCQDNCGDNCRGKCPGGGGRGRAAALIGKGGRRSEMARGGDGKKSTSQHQPVTWTGKDGDAVTAGTQFGTVRGSARSILVAERIALNFMQRMSGTATATRKLVEVRAHGNSVGVGAWRQEWVGRGGGREKRGSMSSTGTAMRKLVEVRARCTGNRLREARRQEWGERDTGKDERGSMSGTAAATHTLVEVRARCTGNRLREA